MPCNQRLIEIWTVIKIKYRIFADKIFYNLRVAEMAYCILYILWRHEKHRCLQNKNKMIWNIISSMQTFFLRNKKIKACKWQKPYQLWKILERINLCKQMHTSSCWNSIWCFEMKNPVSWVKSFKNSLDQFN